MVPLTADTPLIINGRFFISTREAATLAGWSPRYILRLCTEGELAGVRLKSLWLVDHDALRAFIAESKSRKEEQRQMLRDLRLSEYAAHQARALA